MIDILLLGYGISAGVIWIIGRRKDKAALADSEVSEEEKRKIKESYKSQTVFGLLLLILVLYTLIGRVVLGV